MGRPVGPEKVVFKRRVLPELVSMLDGVIEAGYKAETHEVVIIPDDKWAQAFALKDREIAELKKQSMDAVNESVSLRAKVEDLARRLDVCSRASDDIKFKRLQWVFDQYKLQYGPKNEFDQETT